MAVPTLSVTIDGHPYTLRPTELDAWQSATFEAAAGLSVEALLGKIDDADEDELTLVVLAKFCFLCSIQAETGDTFEEVARRIRFESGFSTMVATGFGDDSMIGVEDDETETETEEVEPEPTDPPIGPAGSSDGEPGSSPGSVGSAATT